MSSIPWFLLRWIESTCESISDRVPSLRTFATVGRFHHPLLALLRQWITTRKPSCSQIWIWLTLLKWEWSMQMFRPYVIPIGIHSIWHWLDFNVEQLHLALNLWSLTHMHCTDRTCLCWLRLVEYFMRGILLWVTCPEDSFNEEILSQQSSPTCRYYDSICQWKRLPRRFERPSRTHRSTASSRPSCCIGCRSSSYTSWSWLVWMVSQFWASIFRLRLQTCESTFAVTGISYARYFDEAGFRISSTACRPWSITLISVLLPDLQSRICQRKKSTELWSHCSPLHCK